MFEIFEDYIADKAPLTKEDLRLIRSYATEKRLRRKQVLLHEGEICRCKTFVCKGLLRTYQVKEDGSEYIMRFSNEGLWIVDPESYNNQKPTEYNIEAIEETEVLMWTREHIEEIFSRIPAFRSFSERLIIRTLDESQKRIRMHISYTAEEKYQEFIRSFPDVFERVPLHMVASYLGVSRETLSRIRHGQLKRLKEY